MYFSPKKTYTWLMNARECEQSHYLLGVCKLSSQWETHFYGYNEKDGPKCWWMRVDIGFLRLCCLKCKARDTFGKQSIFLYRLNTNLPCNSILRNLPRRNENICPKQDLHSDFIAALFVIVQMVNKCPLASERLNIMWCRMYSRIWHWNKVSMHATTTSIHLKILLLTRLSESCSVLSDSLWPQGQAPLSMGFSRQEYWSGLPFPSPGDLPDPGVEPVLLSFLAGSLPFELPGKSQID